MKLDSAIVRTLVPCAVTIALGALSGCSSNCKKKIEEVRAFVEVEDRGQWLSESYDLLKECRDYCEGYTDVRDCRFVRFVPARDAPSGGGAGGESGSTSQPGTIETVCTANTADSCE